MTALTVEGFAETRALLDAGQVRGEVLAARGLDDAGWREEEERILSDLADDADAGELAGIRAFNASYRATWTAVTGAPPIDRDASSSSHPAAHASPPPSVSAPAPRIDPGAAAMTPDEVRRVAERFAGWRGSIASTGFSPESAAPRALTSAVPFREAQAAPVPNSMSAPAPAP